MPLDGLLVVEDARARLLEVVEHPLAETEQRRAGGRDPNLAAEPEKQLLLQLLLEQQNLAADRRLRQVQLPPAPVKEPVSATARRISSCRRSTLTPVRSPVPSSQFLVLSSRFLPRCAAQRWRNRLSWYNQNASVGQSHIGFLYARIVNVSRLVAHPDEIPVLRFSVPGSQF